MRAIALALLWAGISTAAAVPLSSNWDAVRGSHQLDSSVQRQGRPTVRLDGDGSGDGFVRSAPVSLRVGKDYELSGWIKSEGIGVEDRGRSPIAVGAAISMASMPFDFHSQSVSGTRDWTRVTLRFTATRSQDRIVLSVGNGGAFRGKAWFDGVSIDEVSRAKSWPSKEAVTNFGPAYRYPTAGWIYLHIEGEPYDRGYQHGYLMAKELESYLDRCAAELDGKSSEQAWSNGRTAAGALFLKGFDKEILQEMQGIADGAAAQGAKWRNRRVDLMDVVLANTVVELGTLNEAMTLTPTGLEGLGLRPPKYLQDGRDVPGHDRCSAFAATGKATKDGHMVIGHTTWWPLTLAEQSNVLLDIQPTKGRRLLMQSYAGGIESGTDWYQNDAGVVLTETTIQQSPFNREGTPVAYRARKAIQYGDTIDKVVEYLSVSNNGLYTNEWIIGDAKTDEIAMLELGTNKTRLYRSSRNDWFAGTEGFYWGCNNAKDLQVRLEYAPDPKGQPQHLPFTPAPRDVAWQQLYKQHKGSIDESFGFLAFRTAPLVSASAMDAKVITKEMAANFMVWGIFGKPNQREWVPSPHQAEYAKNDGLYSSGYQLITGRKPEIEKVTFLPSLAENKKPAPLQVSSERLWKGWILPATDADLWLSAGSETYHRALGSDNIENELNELRAEYRGTALRGDVPLAHLKTDPASDVWSRLASRKGALLLDALRMEMGTDKFLRFMKSYFDSQTTKSASTASFREAAGKEYARFFDKWLTETGLPGDRGKLAYLAPNLGARLGSTLIVYGTMMDAGANRYAAEELQKKLMNWREIAAPIRKDFELTDEELRTRDLVFIGRPESNSALAGIASQLSLEYDGAMFKMDGIQHSSEYESLVLTANNPFDARHMALVVAGNSALQTVKTVKAFPPYTEYAIYRDGQIMSGGFRD